MLLFFIIAFLVGLLLAFLCSFIFLLPWICAKIKRKRLNHSYHKLQENRATNLYELSNIENAESSVALDSVNQKLYDNLSTCIDTKQHAKISEKNLKLQFSSLPGSTSRSVTHSLCNENKNKNKDKQNLPYNSTRVILTELEGVGTEDYINASYINGYDRERTYIAAQGPKFFTIKDFWRMIWLENVEVIVMATNFVERNMRKCAEYFPQRINAIFECGAISIKLIRIKIYEHYDNRYFEVRYKEHSREIQHLHLKWNPDDLSPLYPEQVIPLAKRISEIREGSTAPIVVHCSVGVNRTGMLILCDMALHMAKTETTLDFYSLLGAMRDQRPNMISNEKQYILAHLVVLECLIENKKTTKNILMENMDAKVLQRQLQNLERIGKHDKMVKSWAKYSNGQIESALSSVQVTGYAKQQKYLITEQPTENLLHYFWDTILEEKICKIVFFNKTKHKLWPYQRKNSDTFVKIEEELGSVSNDYHTLTKLKLLKIQLPKKNVLVEHRLDFYQVNGCTPDLTLKNSRGIIDVVEQTHKNCFTTPVPILVACYDGITNSGMFVALSYVIQKYKNEGEIDICNPVRILRRSGKKIIGNQVQLEILYKAVQEYLQDIHTYHSVV